MRTVTCDICGKSVNMKDGVSTITLSAFAPGAYAKSTITKDACTECISKVFPKGQTEEDKKVTLEDLFQQYVCDIVEGYLDDR